MDRSLFSQETSKKAGNYLLKSYLSFLVSQECQ